MKTNLFSDLTVIQAANGVLVRRNVERGYVSSADDMHVFNDFEDFTTWLKEIIVDTGQEETDG